MNDGNTPINEAETAETGERVTIYIDPELVAWMKRIKKTTGVSASFTGQQALREYKARVERMEARKNKSKAAA